MLSTSHIGLGVLAPHAPAALAGREVSTPPGVLSSLATGWALDSRVAESPWLGQFTGCPDGQRNAAESECLAAVQEAAQALGLPIGRLSKRVNVSGVPSGCSYSQVSKKALFNDRVNSPAAPSYQLVCIDVTPALKPLEDHRIGWLHIPKAGTSFGTSLAHVANSWSVGTSGVELLPADAQMVDCTAIECTVTETREFIGRFPFETYYPDVFWRASERSWGDHTPLSGDWKDFRGRMFSTFREPHSRLVSGWHYFTDTSMPLEEYAVQTAGSMTSMLAGQQQYPLRCLNKPSHNQCPWTEEPNVSLALQRLDDFAFVGLTGEWELSMCLLHAMPGAAPVVSAELSNSRPNSIEADPASEPATKDQYDDVVYEAIASRFWADVSKAGLSRELCTSTLHLAGVLPEEMSRSEGLQVRAYNED